MLWFQFSDGLKRQKERQSLFHLSHLLQILINLITSFKEWKLCQATWGIRIKQRNLFLLSSLSGEDMNVVPIVMGGANYSKLAIPGSYINVMDFKTVKQFAEYLQYLDKNNTAYNEYFKWRLKYKVFRSNLDLSMCQICKWYVSRYPLKPKVYDDLAAHWVKKGRCNVKNSLITSMWED